MIDPEMFRPSRHYGAVIDAINDDFVDSRLIFESVLKLEIGGDLLGGSRGGEGSGETDEDDGFVGGVGSEVDLFGGKARVEFHRGEL